MFTRSLIAIVAVVAMTGAADAGPLRNVFEKIRSRFQSRLGIYSDFATAAGSTRAADCTCRDCKCAPPQAPPMIVASVPSQAPSRPVQNVTIPAPFTTMSFSAAPSTCVNGSCATPQRRR